MVEVIIYLHAIFQFALIDLLSQLSQCPTHYRGGNVVCLHIVLSRSLDVMSSVCLLEKLSASLIVTWVL